MSEVVFSHDCIILDACCIINLYASRQFGNILESIPKAVAVATYVRNEEARRIYGGPDDNVMQIEEQIQLQLVTTLELIKHWVDTMDIPSDVVHTALQNVRARGRYEPHAKHPLCGWWRACMQCR